MSVYRKVICPTCSKVAEFRPGDKVKDVTCKRCSHAFKVNDDNANYYIDYFCHGRRYREKIGTSKTLAEKALAKRLTEVAENKFLDIKKDKDVAFEDFADQYHNLHSKVNNRSWKRNDARIIVILK